MKVTDKLEMKREQHWLHDAGGLQSIQHFILLRTESGLRLLGGSTFELINFIIDPLCNCKLVHNGGSAKHNRLFWCPIEVAKEKRKSFRKRHWGDWEETWWQPNGRSSKVSGILERNLPLLGSTWCEQQHSIKHTVTCMSALLTLKMLYV